MFIWNEQNIKWFRDASAYTGFHKALAQKIIPHLQPGVTLCDVGCGLGRLDLELAAYMSEITALDLNGDVIKALCMDVGAAGVYNINARCCDAESFEGSFDYMIMSFVGLIDMRSILKRCRKKLIRIVGVGNKIIEDFYPIRYRRAENIMETVPFLRDELTSMGMKFELELHAIEFGQPLRSWRDAELFVETKAPEAGADEVNQLLNEKIRRTGREDFPFYLPKKKELGIFIIDKEK